MVKLIENEVKVKLLQRLIIASWLLLAICFIIKICGANIFEIMCNNTNFIKVCNYIDTHIWAKYIICCLSSYCSVSLFILAVIRQYKFKVWQRVIVLITILIGCAIKLWNSYIGLGVDFVQFIIIPIIFLGKPSKLWFRPFVALLLNIIFQVISALIKNIKIEIIDDNTLLSLIYIIDVYIMLVLYYLYNNLRKEKMGLLLGIFFVRDITTLEEIKKKNIAKIEKATKERVKARLIAENEAIDKRIAELNEKNK